jgi:hypothetical protein
MLMVQFARREDFRESSGDLLAKSIGKLLDRQMEVFKKKRAYDTNLRLLKGIEMPDAERLVHLPRPILEEHIRKELNRAAVLRQKAIRDRELELARKQKL